MKEHIVTIDMTTRSVEHMSPPEAYVYKGGRALTSTMVSDLVDPLCHPLGEDNVLIFAPGLISGSYLSSSNRLSAGSKSPLTGGIKESNAGGVVGMKLKKLGIKALVIKGSAITRDFPALGIFIDNEGVRIEDFSSLKGLGTYVCAQRLYQTYGKHIGVLVIGPAGEQMLNTACINVTDGDGEPCRNLGRGGLGAVLGSKGIKALIIDDALAAPLYQEHPRVKERIRKFAAQLREHPVTGEKFAKYGTIMTLMGVQGLGGLPTRNFSEGTYEDAENISAEVVRQNMLDRGGNTSHACMPGCVIRCSNKYVDKDGKPIVGSMEFETVGLLGANLAVSDPDAVAEMNYMCNDIGIDTMETGCALGVLCDAGIASFGDTARFKELLNEVGKGTPMGKVLGSGAEICGKVFSVLRVPSVKGQGMAAYDPRVVKGMGVTYAESAMGADHTAANAITLDGNPFDTENKVEDVRELMIRYMLLDSLGLCIFTGRVSLGDPQMLADIVEDFTGRSCTIEQLEEEAWEVLLKEKLFNKRAGIHDESDDVPAYMRKEPLPPHNYVFDVPREKLATFYKKRSHHGSPHKD